MGDLQVGDKVRIINAPDSMQEWNGLEMLVDRAEQHSGYYNVFDVWWFSPLTDRPDEHGRAVFTWPVKGVEKVTDGG